MLGKNAICFVHLQTAATVHHDSARYSDIIMQNASSDKGRSDDLSKKEQFNTLIKKSLFQPRKMKISEGHR